MIEGRTKVEDGYRLGRVKRTCDTCGKEWIGPSYCGQGSCRSLQFTEQDVRPSGMEITRFGITAFKEPPKPKVVADPKDINALRELRSQLVATEARLIAADAAARRLVNANSTNHEIFGFLQEALNNFTQVGDFEVRVIDPLKMISLVPVIRGLIFEIDRTLAKFEQERKK